MAPDRGAPRGQGHERDQRGPAGEGGGPDAGRPERRPSPGDEWASPATDAARTSQVWARNETLQRALDIAAGDRVDGEQARTEPARAPAGREAPTRAPARHERDRDARRDGGRAHQGHVRSEQFRASVPAAAPLASRHADQREPARPSPTARRCGDSGRRRLRRRRAHHVGAPRARAGGCGVRPRRPLWRLRVLGRAPPRLRPGEWRVQPVGRADVRPRRRSGRSRWRGCCRSCAVCGAEYGDQNRSERFGSTAVILLLILGLAVGGPLHSRWPDYVQNHTVKIAFLTLVGALVGLVAARACLWLVHGGLKRLGGGDLRDDSAVPTFLSLGADLNRFLSILGAILGLIVLSASAQRQTVLDFAPATNSPTRACSSTGSSSRSSSPRSTSRRTLTLASVGAAICDQVFPAMPPTGARVGGAHRDPREARRCPRPRRRLGRPVQDKQFAILTPLVGSLVGLLLK